VGNAVFTGGIAMSLTRFCSAFTLTACFAALAAGADTDAEKLHGTWVGKNEGQTITLRFGPKNTVKMTLDKDTIEGTYSVDLGKKPAQLDIDWPKEGKVKTIVELTEDKLKMEDAQPGKDRPKMFTKKAVTLTKEKTK
jgi:uncharacterized protein (TIGR03067 family)